MNHRLLLHLLPLVCILLGSADLTAANQFYVGGKDGWVVKPAESYGLWAQSLRFQIGDKIVFKYVQGEDSVLLVRKVDYDSCNTNNPIKESDDGNSVFLLDRSGPFFFISGEAGHCAQGQKLVVVVMAVRKTPPPSSPSPSPAPDVPPPSASPPTPASSPSPAPAARPPSPAPPTPASTPSPAPPISPTPTPVPSSAQGIEFLGPYYYVVFALLLGAGVLR